MNTVKLILVLIASYRVSGLNPVLMVPGDGGSILMAKYTKPPPHYLCGSVGDQFMLWLNLFYLTPITLDCFIHTAKLEYNPKNRMTFSPDFCEITVSGFGTSDSIEYFSNVKINPTSYFHYIITDLIKTLGYVPNKSLRGAPYDFRKAPNEMVDFQNDLRQLIEQMFVENSNSPVIIMAHSMGNLYLLRLLHGMSQQWKDKYIKSFISISAPYLGAVDAVRTVLSGNNEHIVILSNIDLRAAQSTWPSTYFLMPVPDKWSSGPIVLTKNVNFTVNSFPQLLNYSGIQYAEDHLRNVRAIMERAVAPNVPVHCIYTEDIPTSEILDYRGGDFPNNKPTIIFGSGDGTVNLRSLQQCTNWQREQNEPVITHIVPGVKHLPIMRDSRLIDIVRKIIGKFDK